MYPWYVWAALAAITALLYTIAEVVVRRRQARAQALGFLPLAPIATFLGSAALKALLSKLGSLAGGFATIVAAVIAAIPPTLDAIGKSPLLAFLFGVLIASAPALLIGYRHGVESYPVALSTAKATAINLANKRADTAIARFQAEFEKAKASMSCPPAPKPECPKPVKKAGK